MIKKTIKYEDFDGNPREEDFYFNLSKAEVLEMAVSEKGGYDKLLEKIIAERDPQKLFEHFKAFIQASYGEKDLEGKRFIKNKEVLDNFMQTNAYTELVMELLTNDGAGADFINGIMPKDLMKEIEKKQ